MTVKSKKDLKNEYKISYVTLKKWLDKIPGLINSNKKYFTPKEVDLIYNHLGEPLIYDHT